MRTSPSSRAVRSASSLWGPSSQASSRNRMPRCALLIAPGLARPTPPPTRAGPDVEWCGATKGATVMSGASGDSKPATECTAVTDRDCSIDRLGRRPGSLRASMVLPVPGGPTSKGGVAAGGGDFRGPAGLGLADDVGEVVDRRWVGGDVFARREQGVVFAVQPAQDVTQAVGAPDFDAGDQGRLGPGRA